MTRRLQILLGLALLMAVVAGLFRASIERMLTTSLVLHQDSPNETVVLELFESTDNPSALLQRFWASNKIPHRYLVAKFLNLPENQRLIGTPKIKQLLEEAANDVDFNVRELALATLEHGESEDFHQQLMNQLRDADPNLRIKALQYLRQYDAASNMANVIALLDDPEPLVVASAAGVFRLWTNNDFGIRNRDAVAKATDGGVHLVPEEAHARLMMGVSAWKNWWTDERKKFPSPTITSQTIPPASLPAEDFALEDLDGNSVRLSDFSGKTVLLNFWTTWCTACVMEMPDLVELDARFDDDFVILGISLDGDDGHGHDHAAIVDLEAAHEHGVEAVEGLQESDLGKHDHDHEGESKSSSKILKRIRRTVARKGLTYRILLDPSQQVGNRFDGHELPTNVLIDKDGFVRRRFIGSRPLAAWEAMIREIQ